jgi:hypothetical protein
MHEDEIDRTILEIMKELRESSDYLGHACNANKALNCSQEDLCSPENPKRLKKGINCGVKPHCERNQISNDGV